MIHHFLLPTRYPRALYWMLLFTLMASLSSCGGEGTGSDDSLDSLLEKAEKTAPISKEEKSGDRQSVSPEKVVQKISSTVLERNELKFGFIKLTDCAPIVIAKEKGFFDEVGLQVDVEAQPNWKTLLDRVISGELDGAHMLSGQPIAATIGFGTKAHIITAYTMDQNGNGITVSNAIWEQMQENDSSLKLPQPKHPISANTLRPIVEERKASGQLLKMGMVFPVSTHNYELRYWLAASGIHPGFYTNTDKVGETDAEVLLSVTPPPMMPTVLEAGNIQGYCVGEPWNQQAVAKGIGVPVTTNYDVWKNNPEKVFGVTKKWADENPITHIAVIKALIKAGKWLDSTNSEGDLVNREEACRILAQPNYVGADYDVIKNSMTGFFYFQKSDKRKMPEFNIFFKDHATYPWYSDGIWFLTQMRRWGQITESKPDAWYHETIKKVYRPDIYRLAAAELIQEGELEESEIPPVTTDGYKPATNEFIDGMTYDGRYPVKYLNSMKIGNKDLEASS